MIRKIDQAAAQARDEGFQEVDVVRSGEGDFSEVRYEKIGLQEDEGLPA